MYFSRYSWHRTTGYQSGYEAYTRCGRMPEKNPRRYCEESANNRNAAYCSSSFQPLATIHPSALTATYTEWGSQGRRRPVVFLFNTYAELEIMWQQIIKAAPQKAHAHTLLLLWMLALWQSSPVSLWKLGGNKTRQIKLKQEHMRQRKRVCSIHLMWGWSLVAGTLSINERNINSLDQNQHPQISLHLSSPPLTLLPNS